MILTTLFLTHQFAIERNKGLWGTLEPRKYSLETKLSRLKQNTLMNIKRDTFFRLTNYIITIFDTYFYGSQL